MTCAANRIPFGTDETFIRASMKNKLLAAAVTAATIAVAATLLAAAHHCRCRQLFQRSCAALQFFWFARYRTSRRSLTLGFCRPSSPARNSATTHLPSRSTCKLLGTIFLRLIKVIIRAAAFRCPVVGIAGHSDLKKVGRPASVPDLL